MFEIVNMTEDGVHSAPLDEIHETEQSVSLRNVRVARSFLSLLSLIPGIEFAVAVDVFPDEVAQLGRLQFTEVVVDAVGTRHQRDRADLVVGDHAAGRAKATAAAMASRIAIERKPSDGPMSLQTENYRLTLT